MNKLGLLSSEIEEIKKLSDLIIRKSIPIIKHYSNVDTVKGLKTQNPSIKDIEKRIKNESLKLIDDSKKIKGEIVDFVDVVLGIKTFDDVKVPFLQGVWMGDVYETSGYDSIFSLKKDLTEQLENCTNENFAKKLLV
jgi:hypothetical protein